VIVSRTPLGSTAATTLKAAEQELGLLAGHGLPLERWINAASDLIVRMIGRDLAAALYVEDIPGSGLTSLLLEARPFISVESVTYQGVPITDFVASSTEPAILYRQLGWPETMATSTWLTDNVVATSINDYEITYRAGYYMPGDAVPTLPARYEQACLLLVRQFYLQRGKDGSIKSESVGDLSVTYAARGGVAIPEVYELLGLEIPQ
jgi:hypothetical protein